MFCDNNIRKYFWWMIISVQHFCISSQMYICFCIELTKTNYNFEVSTVPADCLTLLGTRTSTGTVWVGALGLCKMVATFNHVGGSFNIIMGTTGDVWIIPSFRNFGLCTACWARFMCHHELWATSVSHTFSFRNSSLGLAEGKHDHKITIPIWKKWKYLEVLGSCNRMYTQ